MLISLNNGNSYITAAEALEVMPIADVLHYIDIDSDAYTHTDNNFSGETDQEWLEMFLEAHHREHDAYFVIG